MRLSYKETSNMKKRTYSIFSYADKYLWKLVIADDTQKGIRDALGNKWVDDEVQLGTLFNKLGQQGYTGLLDEMIESLEESDVIVWASRK